MKPYLIILYLFSLTIIGCRTWDWGSTLEYKIPEGKHSDVGFPMMIEGTKKWGGEMVLEYDPNKMIDTVENFAYWNKLGGIMPDLTSNYIVGKHQSARAAWRVDPEDTNYFYIGYIVYVWGQDKPERDYLLDHDGEKIRIPVGVMFSTVVVKYSDHWGVCVYYGSQVSEKRVNDEELKREKFLVAMDPYYGGNPTAPTDINITLKIIDTTWVY